MDAKWLNTQFQKKPSKSKAELARLLGLEAPAISKMLNGSRQIKAPEYVRMLDFFEIRPSKSGQSAEDSQNYVLKPLEKNNAMHDFDGHGDGEWVMPASVLAPHTAAPSDKVKIFDIKENMMEPDFRKGEHVMVDVTDKKPSPPGVFVVSDGFGTLTRYCEFMPNSKPPKIKISAYNSSFQPQILGENEFKIMGRVIAKLQWI